MLARRHVHIACRAKLVPDCLHMQDEWLHFGVHANRQHVHPALSSTSCAAEHAPQQNPALLTTTFAGFFYSAYANCSALWCLWQLVTVWAVQSSLCTAFEDTMCVHTQDVAMRYTSKGGWMWVTCDRVIPPFMLRSMRALTGIPAAFSMSPCTAYPVPQLRSAWGSMPLQFVMHPSIV